MSPNSDTRSASVEPKRRKEVEDASPYRGSPDRRSRGQMAPPVNLGEFEQLVLLAILRLGDSAYGVTIRAEIADRPGRTVATGALYTALERLESKGLITSRRSDPTPQRGGRAKRHVTVTVAGIEALNRALQAYERLLDGLKLAQGAHA